MYKEEFHELLPFLDCEKGDFEEQAREIAGSEFLVRARIRHKTLKTNVPFEEREVFAFCIGPRYMPGFMKHEEILYFQGIDDRSCDIYGLTGVRLRDLLEFERL